MTDREKLIELVCESTNHDCGKHCNLSSAIHCFSCTAIADHLLANGVTVQQPKKPRTEPDLTGKCGSCGHSAPTESYGGSKCYVECTLKEHLQKHCTMSKYTAVRPRTNKGCKNYMPKEG